MPKSKHTEVSVRLNFRFPSRSNAAVLGRISAAVLGALCEVTPGANMMVRSPKRIKSGSYVIQIDRVAGGGGR